MKQRLSLQNIIGMGFLAFAMFLGAGNLIFPPLAGQLAGTATWIAAAGFLITGVGLPLLGLIIIARVGGGFNEITKELPRGMIIFIGSCIYLIIGPIYAVPRTGMVAYEVGMIPFLETPDATSRFFYSLIFFSIAWYLSLYPGKLLTTVGKFITPALLLLLIVLGISPIIMPLGDPGAAIGDYAENPFIKGFLEGYMTMDTLAALMFGIVIITNLRSHGVTSSQVLFRHSVIAGTISACTLTLVYLSLFYLGATSRVVIPYAENGGQILAIYVDILFGIFGSILLAMVVSLACLTTAIGCITAASEYFSKLTNKICYSWIVAVISIFCMIFANLGLNQIIKLFIPALLILHPICIVLIFLGLVRDRLPTPTLVYRSTLLVAFLLSLVDVAKSFSIPFLHQFIESFNVIPGYNAKLSWLFPSLACAIMTALFGKLFCKNRLQEDQA